MKCEITATLDGVLIAELERVVLEERRSGSEIIGSALEQYFRTRGDHDDRIVITPGRFVGSFSRHETYDR